MTVGEKSDVTDPVKAVWHGVLQERRMNSTPASVTTLVLPF